MHRLGDTYFIESRSLELVSSLKFDCLLPSSAVTYYVRDLAKNSRESAAKESKVVDKFGMGRLSEEVLR